MGTERISSSLGLVLDVAGQLDTSVLRRKRAYFEGNFIHGFVCQIGVSPARTQHHSRSNSGPTRSIFQSPTGCGRRIREWRNRTIGNARTPWRVARHPTLISSRTGHRQEACVDLNPTVHLQARKLRGRAPHRNGFGVSFIAGAASPPRADAAPAPGKRLQWSEIRPRFSAAFLHRALSSTVRAADS